MTDEQITAKKMAILTEQYRSANEAYVDTLSKYLVAQDYIVVLSQKNADLEDKLTKSTGSSETN